MADLSPLAVAVPFLVAAALVASLRFHRRRDDLVAVLTAIAVAVFCGVLITQVPDSGLLVADLGGWQPTRGGAVLGIVLAIDPLGAALATLAAVLVAVALLFTWRFFDIPGPAFHALVLVFLGALVGFSLSGDLFNLFVFFELMSVSAYALTAYRINRPAALQGALGFAVVNSIGAMLILFGIALVYGRTGALNLAAVGESLASRPADGLVVVAFALIVGGFMVKAAIVPFHFWLADAYAVAPTPAAIVFTGVMSDLGLFAIARVYWGGFEGALGGSADELRAVLVGFAVLTMLVGGVMCLLQPHLKRMLAFATISQIGVALVGVGLLTPAAGAGAILLVPADGLLRAGLFVCIGIIVHKTGSVHGAACHGRGREVPRLIGWLFIAGALGLAALPPFGAFSGKALLEGAAADAGYAWVIVPVFIATVMTAAALLRAAGNIFLGWGEAPRGPELDTDREATEIVGAPGYVPVVTMATATLLVVAGLGIGTVPGIVDSAQHSATRFTDRATYAATVLDRPAPRPAQSEQTGIGIGEVLISLLTAAAAVTLALALLGRLPYLRAPPALRSAWARGVFRLRRLHSGQVGDYVAWMVLGFAVLGGTIALAT
jgi:multicomponent Na+:H+ antiporter subunit D